MEIELLNTLCELLELDFSNNKIAQIEHLGPSNYRIKKVKVLNND